ncbi:uncharacterized protein [Halyomorpha halys]|uniref:uncharacterized protein n=1 Tax=Halyomorpha halys TaxID=286706 RepID=UPI0034D1BC00
MYNAIFKLTMLEGATVVGFADDIVVVVAAKNLEEVTLIANQAVVTVRGWPSSVGQQLADHKTEVLLVTSRKHTESITVTFGRHEIRSQSFLKYIGVMIDARLRFNVHAEYISAKSAKVASFLPRLMPNVEGPREISRRLLAPVVPSIMLYAVPIWKEMVTKSYRRKLVSVYRRVSLRTVCAFGLFPTKR